LLATPDTRTRAADLARNYAAFDKAARFALTPPGPGSLLRSALDPLVAVGTLAAAAAWFGGRFDGACLILAVLVFAMTFPGSLARSTSTGRDLVIDIATGWVAIVSLLGLFGWASHTLGAFDPRVLLAWALATPAALFAAHRLLPVIMPRVLAVEGMRKTAVIAGANDLGRRVAASLRGDPLLGMRFAGYFDDRGSERMQDVPATVLVPPLRARLSASASSPCCASVILAVPPFINRLAVTTSLGVFLKMILRPS
jgi:hypothetical protein